MSEEINLPENEKFLCLFPTQRVANKFFCCTLRKGVFIMAMLMTVLNIALIVLNSVHYYSHFAYFRIAIDVIRIIGSILLILSLRNENYKYATVSYWLFAGLFYLHIIFNTSFLYRMTINFQHLSATEKMVIWAIIVSFMTLECWLVWIIFSYTKLLKHKQTDIIKKGRIDIEGQYKNINNMSSNL